MGNNISEKYRFDSIRQNFTVGFGIFKRNWLFLLKANLIPFFLTLPLIITAITLAILKNDVANFYIGTCLCIYYVILIISFIFYSFNYQISLYKIYDGEKITFGSLMKRPDARIFLIIVASFIIGILMEIGFVLFIIPGFYFAYRYAFVIDLILDKNKSLSEAMELSSKMTKDKKSDYFFMILK